MAEIINLRRARKAQARQAADRVAAENRLLHGRSKGETLRQRLEAAKAERSHAAHKREHDEP